MDDHLEESLREGMHERTDALKVPADLPSRAVSRYRRRRRIVRGGLVAGGGAAVVAAIALVLAYAVFPSSPATKLPPMASPGQAGGNRQLVSLITKYKQTKSVSFDFTLNSSTGQNASGKEWNDGRMVKIETTTVKGVEEVIIADLQTGTVTVYQPSTNQGRVIKATTLSSVPTPIGSLKNVSLGDIKDKGTATVNGEVCRVIQHAITHTNTNGQTVTDEATIWLSERLAFPVKQTVTTPGGGTTTVEFTNVKIGPLPADTFTIPGSVKITAA